VFGSNHISDQSHSATGSDMICLLLDTQLCQPQVMVKQWLVE